MRRFGLSSLVGVCCLLGCSPAPKPIVAVTGKVTMKGKPVTGATVQFVPTDDDGVLATGRTDAAGGYKLYPSKGGLGLTPGPYKVVISRMVGADGKETPEGLSPIMTGGKESLPKFYSDPNETSLTAVVPATTPATVDFPLSGQGGASGAAGGAMGGIRVR